MTQTAAIWDAASFEDLEAGVDKIRAAVLDSTSRSTKGGRTLSTRTEGQKLLLSVIHSSVAVKSFIVTKDEKETGLRNLVNFGHSIGHALEAVLTPYLLHGECVSVGMVLEAEVARALGILSNAAVGRLTRCLKSHGLPVSMTDPRIVNSPYAHALRVPRLLDIMRVDKKNKGNKKRIVLLSRIGKCYEEKATEVDDAIIVNSLAPAMRVLSGPAKTSVQLATPGSKSISNRALVLASLAEGTCRISNLLHSDDTQVMITALQTLKGADISWENDGEVLVVQGGAGKLSVSRIVYPSYVPCLPQNEKPAENGEEIYLGNAGTASRFLTSVCTLVNHSQSTSTVITGNKRMKERPIGALVDALVTNGASISYKESEGSLPLAIGNTGLRGGHMQLAASISSQYVSSILLAAPYAKEEVHLELVGGQVISQPYIDMTIAMMADFGIQVQRLKSPDGSLLDQYRIPRGTYKNPSSYSVESDASSATYPVALAAISGTSCTLTNIGSSSLQGDARFAKEVLEPMGCKVEQTASSTTVTGPPPGQLRPLPLIDMEPMTDAFLTAAALAAVATAPPLSTPEKYQKTHSTRIIGIANQRVKECNRIKAMMDQLAKFGVETHELETGIEVIGIKPEQLKSGANIHCYDDHRVAMAFSILAAAAGGPGATIDERRCVEKTWPSWWDDLSRMGIKVEGVEFDKWQHVYGPARASYDPAATIFLTGMRGSGKTFTGSIGAGLLGRTFVDADDYFEERAQMGVREFVQQNGWPAFRAQELAYFKELVETKSINHVIALGGGIVETPEAHAMLCEYAHTTGPVVNIVRDIDEVVAYLDAERGRPAYGEDIRGVALRRAPLFRSCSSFDFVSHTGVKAMGKDENDHQVLLNIPMTPDDVRRSKESVVRFFQFVTRNELNHTDLTQDHTYFLCLTLPDVNPILHTLDEITAGVDAIELRVDMLSPSGISPTNDNAPPVDYVGQQLASLRKHTALPIIFTVRTKAEGGRFPDNAEQEYFDLLRSALRWGCEYVDLEVGRSAEPIRSLLHAKGDTQIIASKHDSTGRFKWDSGEAVAAFDEGSRIGDIVKLVGTATTLSDNFAMMAFRSALRNSKPLISLNMGAEGKLSRMLNPVFTPVTHPALPSAAPGQLTFADIQKGLELMGLLAPKQFYLFGNPILQSKSPLIHNTGFKLLGLPHQYQAHQIETLDDSIIQCIRASDFGGASVTIPYKVEILPHIDELTEVARVIGAVNTIIPVTQDGARRLLGDNTDWIGIRQALLTSFTSAHQALDGNAAGLVIGAGGTSRAAIYALHSIGMKTIYLFNRSLPNAHSVAEAFPQSWGIKVTTSLDNFEQPPAAIVTCVPAAGTSCRLHENSDAGVFIPDAIFARPQGGVVLDVAYKPYMTPTLMLAETHPNWATRSGIEMLLLQGFGQFKAWTGRGQ